MAVVCGQGFVVYSLLSFVPCWSSIVYRPLFIVFKKLPILVYLEYNNSGK